MDKITTPNVSVFFFVKQQNIALLGDGADIKIFHITYVKRGQRENLSGSFNS